MSENPDLNKLLEKLPFFVKNHVNQHPQKNKIIEIVIDLGRRPEARFSTGPEYLSQKIISWQDIDYITKKLVNLVMKIEPELNLHYIESVVLEIDNF